jgi:hypothetical protein
VDQALGKLTRVERGILRDVIAQLRQLTLSAWRPLDLHLRGIAEQAALDILIGSHHDEELLNRCLTLGVGESREQTRAILGVQRQKRTLDGLFARRQKERLLKVHQNAQRLLRPIAVR